MANARIRTSPVARKAYRVDEVCESLGLGRTKVSDLMDRGVLKRVKIGNLVLITADSVDQLLRGAAE